MLRRIGKHGVGVADVDAPLNYVSEKSDTCRGLHPPRPLGASHCCAIARPRRGAVWNTVPHALRARLRCALALHSEANDYTPVPVGLGRVDDRKDGGLVPGPTL